MPKEGLSNYFDPGDFFHYSLDSLCWFDVLALLVSSALTPQVSLQYCYQDPPFVKRGSGRRCGDVGRFKARAGWESRNYSKYFETRRNATRGACYRWQTVVSNASVLCGLVAMDAPACLGCLSALPSSWCAALHPIPPPPNPPGQVSRVTLVLVRRLCQCLVW